MKRNIFTLCTVIGLTVWSPGRLCGQADVKRVAPLLDQQIQAPEVTSFEIRNYMAGKVSALPQVSSGDQWRKRAAELRRDILSRIVYYGWPREWVEAPVKMEDLGPIPAGKGYRIRKLRYEIVPGFQTTALLYEPEVRKGKVPAVLNLGGHFKEGKAIEFEQKRCINHALNGMIALSPEFIYFGELRTAENDHAWGAALDLVGANTVGLFYLAMRRALDYLDGRPDVDRSRLAVTGLSGGGWQTLVLTALDERVAVAVPVSGFAPISSAIEQVNGIGHIEQNPTDLQTIVDYPHLVAMCAPRPTLLIYSAYDISFTLQLLKPRVFDAVLPFYRLLAAEDRLAWYTNTDPGDHNYQLDNREQSYRFLTKHLGLPIQDREQPVGDQLKSYEELTVGIPDGNLTILGLARKLAARRGRHPIPAAGPGRTEWAEARRSKLKEVVRLQPVTVERMWGLSCKILTGLETRAYRLGFTNQMSARGLWLKAVSAADAAAATITLNDKGRKASADQIAERLNRGEQVLALDVLADGDGLPKVRSFQTNEFLQMAASMGDRPLGLEAAQLIGSARYLRQEFRAPRVRVEASGIRSQMISLVAAAAEPALFDEVVIRDGMKSLQHLLDAPVPPDGAVDLYCQDLFKEFDVDQLVAIAQPVRVKQAFAEKPRQ